MSAKEGVSGSAMIGNGSSTENNNNKKRSLDALDRIALGGASAASNGDTASFVPSASWNGSKSGYYFAAGDQGTGYYRDDTPIGEDAAAPDAEPAPKKRKKKGVQIAEELNETRVILTAEQLLQSAEQEASGTKVMDLTLKGVRNAAKALDKAIQTNQLQRAEHANDPAMYMDSEVALYEHISVLKAVAADPVQLFPATLPTQKAAAASATKTSSAEPLLPTLMQLLLHENPDIVSSVVAVLLEWLDASLLLQQDAAAVVAQVASFFLQHDGADYLVGNLGRLGGGTTTAAAADTNDDDDNNNEDDDEVGKGTEDILSLLENLMDMDLTLQTIATSSDTTTEDLALLPNGKSVAAMLCQDTLLVSWLFQQVEHGANTADDGNKKSQQLRERSLEILALLSPREDVHAALPDWSKLARYKSTLIEDDEEANGKHNKHSNGTDAKKKHAEDTVVDGIEILLQTIAVFRKKQPQDDSQLELLENACMVLASALTFSSHNVQAFLDGQGIELVIRCLKERTHAGGVALKLLDFSGTHPVYQKACEHLVTAAGALKYLSPLFLGKSLPKLAPTAATSKRAKREWVHTTIEPTTIRILYTLCHKLTNDSPQDAKQRLLAKFVGDDRCDRLVEQCLAYDQKARLAEYKFFRSDVEEELQDEAAVQLAALEAKLTGGGDIFHRLAGIAAFCCVGSKRCHERILAQLELKESGIGLIRNALQEFASVLEESDQRRQLESYLEEI